MARQMDDAHSLNLLETILKEVKLTRKGQRTLEGRFDTLEIRFNRLETRFDTLETKVDAIGSRLESVEMAGLDTGRNVKRLQTDMTEVKNRLSTVESRLDSVDARLATREAKPV